MAAGGQGQPCAAYADHVLFARDDRTVATLHLGAFASLTLVPPAFEEMMAFDVGPCNIAIDGALQLLTSGNRELDQGGKRAAKGEIMEELLDYLLEHTFFNRVPPKSASREDFGPEVYLRDALHARKDENPAEDILATVTAAVAFSVTRAYTRFVKPHHEVARVILTGGGAHNKTLVNRLRESLPETAVRTSDHYGLPPAALDAMRAALLGNETLLGRPGNVPHATGASRPVILGAITPA
jgi:anhydro-N-acetylmuramic acid kinase